MSAHSKDEGLSFHPMTEEERDEAMLAARRIIAIDEGEPGADEEVEFIDSVAVARALLSSSSAERGMREAIKKAAVWLRNGDYDTRGGLIQMDRLAGILEAALSARAGEDEQARPSGSASISTDTKGTTK